MNEPPLRPIISQIASVTYPTEKIINSIITINIYPEEIYDWINILIHSKC